MSEKENLTNDEVEINSHEEVNHSTEEGSSNTEESKDEVINPTPEELIEEEKNKYLRLYAEFENFRRRNAKERIELINTASLEIIREVLPVLDDFERAIESNKEIEEVKALKEGFDILYQKLHKTLSSKGLKQIEAKGALFDAEQHEAIAQVPVEKDKEKGIIMEVLEKGYMLNDKIIRHPKVVVGS